MPSVLASQFDPLEILAPCLLGGKLILQRTVASNLAWDDKLPDDIMSDRKTWAKSMEKIVDCFSIPRYCFGNEEINKNTGKQVKYQLHSFCDASNYALSCVVYLRRIVEDRSDVGFLMGKSKVVLKNQVNWIISRKELEAAKLCAELMRDISDSLKYLGCSLYFWTDFQVVLKCIVNPALRLVRFVKRRVDKIYRVGFVDN